MDCLQAAEIVSAALDGELTEAAQLAEARTHCTSCPQCASLLRLLERVHDVPAPQAPFTLIELLEAQALKVAADVRDAEVVAEILPELASPPGRKRPWQWTPRVIALASSAAALLVVFTAGSLTLLAGGQQGAEDSAATVMLSEESASQPPAVPEAGTAQDSTQMRSAELAAPPYVMLGGAVYVQSDVPAPSALEPIGAVTTDLGTGASTSHPALAAPGTNDPIFIRDGDGAEISFSLVTRTMGRATYALVSDVPLERFGEWPTLPTDVPQPTGADGSPVFTRFGFDDRGVDVYAPTPGSIESGFSVAPGTAQSDPAAGNPNWTWWEPVS